MTENMNLLERFERYLKNSGKRPSTITSWHYIIVKIKKWIKDNYKIDIFEENDAARCTPSIMDEWFNDVMSNMAAETKHSTVLAIQKYFEYLVKYNLIPEDKNPTKILPSVKRQIVFHDTAEDSDRVYTNDEIKLMMTSSYPYHTYNEDLKFKAVVSMLLETGLRAFELCSITVGDIRHCKNNTIIVERKGGKRNGVIIGSAAWPYINSYYQACRSTAQDNDPFFVSRRNNPYTSHGLWQFVTPRQKYIGVKEGLHNFRHTATSYVAKAGDMAVARDFAGHSNVVMTNRYTHTSIEDRLKAVNNTDMSKLLDTISKNNPNLTYEECDKDEEESTSYDELDEAINLAKNLDDFEP